MLANVEDYRRAAQRRLPRFLFDYIDGGALSEATLRSNVEDFGSLALRQRVLRDIGEVSLETQLMGQKVSAPFALAPVGLAGINARRGEVQAAKAADAFGVPFCLSTVSLCTVEEVVAAGASPPWFQLYMIRDRGFLRDMLGRAWAAGCRTLVFTVDMPTPGLRYRDKRSGLSGGGAIARQIRRMSQALIRPAWCWDVGVLGRPHTLGHVASVLGDAAGIEQFWGWMADNFDPTVTWRDLDMVREAWPGSIVIKGIMDPDDAREAVAFGAEGIVVSNHGGRQLDGAPSTIRALGPVARAAGGRTTILMDGGVRSGTDVVRAMAAGADGVLLGRAWVYGLAARGGRGVEEVLQIIAAEACLTLALTGCRSVADVNPSLLIDGDFARGG
ncbi:L-lactate dehydrogenase [Brevundimonas sp.]|uniref:L-lactate dehydrogenase n=1 Tax=Brevundimonas sp. TaxID=1871086 RepID=UPI002ABCB09C|nr:L-lactate dehydrogenase [Brevundimonas sp.]MDZ4363117.1 L-lactate dehydrogenase [Brevundimonas sp.]